MNAVDTNVFVMLLAACKEAGVTTLYSEDMAAGTDYDGLVIVDPFV